MPLTSILVLAGIVAAFATFAIVLAWAEHRTRNIRRDQPVLVEKRVAPQDELKMAA
jgi:hypothetical protein